MFRSNSKPYVLAALSLLTGGHVASAADLPQRPEYKAPAIVTPAPSWTGCYIGGNVGYGWGRADVESSTGGISWTNGGVIGGGQIGCDYQFAGTGFVVGIRDMFDWTGLSGSGTFASGALAGSIASSNTKWANTLTGRIGYAVIPAGLFYVQGGGAWSRMDVTITNGAGVQTGQFANNKGGYDVGAGFEYKFAPNWSGFIEYNYMNFGTNSATTTTGVNVNLKKDSQNILFGVNWRM
ncbi:outer membrane protein [Rhodoplanes sp. Z2-YC6860]|uniref:outer membrane protein n=1 Tax=Rhodoplanes sp. Z2-YC6860 TaxID=674703 RepID=UPI00078CBF98|nr:outer membrane beta-barrel protein [Rhodoplanes sp. Z2-YC6860]AMN43671.1 outer-membrane immunogenic protein [Rhodoplanes sp. Z2-YC6860]